MQKTDQQIEQVVDKLAASTRSPRGEFSMEATRPLLEKRIAAQRRRRFLRIVSSAAAVLILGIMSWGTYVYMQPADILTVSTLAETKLVELPDGSRVTLNRYSTLSYPEKFKTANREISLTGGAYFAVNKDANHPFIVQAGDVDVRVLGTEFNVEAYPRDELIKTTLFEGSVAFEAKEGENLVLVPGESAVYDKVAKSVAKAQNPQSADEIAWQNGALIFSELPLKEVVRQLSNRFNVEIQINSHELEQIRMTGRFIHGETLDNILQLLQGICEFEVTQKQDIIQIHSAN